MSLSIWRHGLYWVMALNSLLVMWRLEMDLPSPYPRQTREHDAIADTARQLWGGKVIIKYTGQGQISYHSKTSCIKQY